MQARLEADLGFQAAAKRRGQDGGIMTLYSDHFETLQQPAYVRARPDKYNRSLTALSRPFPPNPRLSDAVKRPSMGLDEGLIPLDSRPILDKPCASYNCLRCFFPPAAELFLRINAGGFSFLQREEKARGQPDLDASPFRKLVPSSHPRVYGTLFSEMGI